MRANVGPIAGQGRRMDGVQTVRVYDIGASGPPGKRVLVDRVWPRGLKRDELHLDLWLRDIAPSPELRAWFGHRPERWHEFRRRYRAELVGAERASLVEQLVATARKETILLLFGARDRQRNQAVVLAEVIAERLD